jgi:hypothetical protein
MGRKLQEPFMQERAKDNKVEILALQTGEDLWNVNVVPSHYTAS